MSQSSPAGVPGYMPVVPAPQKKKPFYRRWWFIAIVSLFVIGSLSQAVNGQKEATSTNSPSRPASASAEAAPAASASKIVPAAPATTTPAAAPAAAKPDVPREYQNALESAKSYSKFMHMSKKAIYDQLTGEYDKFPAEAAQYAVDNLQVDYKANALASAKSYQKTMHMSSEAIRSQLTSEYADKFTAEEADYAVTHLND